MRPGRRKQRWLLLAGVCFLFVFIKSIPIAIFGSPSIKKQKLHVIRFTRHENDFYLMFLPFLLFSFPSNTDIPMTEVVPRCNRCIYPEAALLVKWNIYSYVRCGVILG